MLTYQCKRLSIRHCFLSHKKLPEADHREGVEGTVFVELIVGLLGLACRLDAECAD